MRGHVKVSFERKAEVWNAYIQCFEQLGAGQAVAIQFVYLHLSTQ